MSSWTHPAGRFVLLGDACHATLPYLAQGAAMAVEDGAVLGGLLAGVGREDKENLHPVLMEYENLRKKRTTGVVRGSSQLREIFHMRDGPEQEERDRRYRGPAEGSPMPWRNPKVQKWLFGYDAEQVVRDAWNRDGGLKEVYGKRRVDGREGVVVTSRI